jgi:hypothetical protein
VVIADSGRCYKLYAAARQQLFVTAGAGADYQGIGIVNVISTDARSRQIHYLISQLLQLFADKRYLIVNNYLPHDASS